MNIQIFGISKSFDTKKAQRYFSERNIKVQYIDLNQKAMSKGEFRSVKNAVGSLDALIDDNAKDKELLTLFRYLTEDAKEEKLLDHPSLLKTPIVRNGKMATVGYKPEVWKTWQ